MCVYSKQVCGENQVDDSKVIVQLDKRLMCQNQKMYTLQSATNTVVTVVCVCMCVYQHSWYVWKEYGYKVTVYLQVHISFCDFLAMVCTNFRTCMRTHGFINFFFEVQIRE